MRSLKCRSEGRFTVCAFKKSTNMLHLIWTDIQSVVQLKTQLLLKIKPLCVRCCTSKSTTECFTVWLYMQNPRFFACSRRCARPLAWTESNSSQLVFKCAVWRTGWIFDLANQQRIDLNLFLPRSFQSSFPTALHGYSGRWVCARACLCMPKCLCV